MKKHYHESIQNREKFSRILDPGHLLVRICHLYPEVGVTEELEGLGDRGLGGLCLLLLHALPLVHQLEQHLREQG